MHINKPEWGLHVWVNYYAQYMLCKYTCLLYLSIELCILPNIKGWSLLHNPLRNFCLFNVLLGNKDHWEKKYIRSAHRFFSFKFFIIYITRLDFFLEKQYIDCIYETTFIVNVSNIREQSIVAADSHLLFLLIEYE